MFGTTLTVLDGYARTINESFQLLGWQKMERKNSYNYWLLAQAAAGMAVILFFKSALGPMLTFAMSLAFITTPVFAWLNYRLMRGQQKHLMQPWIRLLSWLGLIYLFGFALLFIWWYLSK
jgi:Mn2+/Fe2+ NRAMP family transporter